MFIPGQQVVCVDATFPPSLAQYFSKLPQKDSTYTIRDVVPGIAPNGGEGEVAVYLVEIFGSVNPHGIERGFNAERFAPLAPYEAETAEQEAELVAL